MNKPQRNKPALKQTPLTDDQIERLENYFEAKRVDLAALIASRRQQPELARKPSIRKPTPA